MLMVSQKFGPLCTVNGDRESRQMSRDSEAGIFDLAKCLQSVSPDEDDRPTSEGKGQTTLVVRFYTSGAAITLAAPGASGSNRVDDSEADWIPTESFKAKGLLPHPTSY